MGLTPSSDTSMLVVCSANQARSPVAAELFRRQFAQVMDREATHQWWPIRSAGVDAAPGLPLLPAMAKALAHHGLEPIEHTSVVLTTELVERARLVVTMTGDQRHRVNRMSPLAVGNTFTLKELDRLLSSQRSRTTVESVRDPVAQLHALRPMVPPAERDEDVADPAIGPARISRVVLDELVLLVQRVAGELARWGAVPEPNASVR